MTLFPPRSFALGAEKTTDIGTGHMKLGYVVSSSRGEIDPLLADVARHLALRGLRLSGTVQVNTERPGSRHCDMDLTVLPNGPTFRISRNRGNEARGCRLDAGSLETAVAHVAASVDTGADLLILNKFGRHEAEGRGFRSVIAMALDREIPVLVGLNDLYLESFDNFCSELATEIHADIGNILRWLDHASTRAKCQTDLFLNLPSK